MAQAAESAEHLKKWEGLLEQHAAKAFKHLLILKGVTPTERLTRSFLAAWKREVPAFMRRCAESATDQVVDS